MPQISTSEKQKNLIRLHFEGECLQALQKFTHPSKSGNEEQVRVDLRRVSGLTIGKWSYRNSSESADIKVEPDPEEVFFYRLKRLDKKFQDFIFLNFHQGGMFFVARQFLTFHLNSFGFKPSSNGFEHHFICDFDNEELVITEKFNITGLEFVDPSLVSKVTIKNEEFSRINFQPVDLEPADKEKILFFQKNIMELLGDEASFNYQQAKLRLEEKLKGEEKISQLVSYPRGKNLIEFTVRHTIKLDPTSLEGIKIEELSKDDVNFKVQAELYELNSQTSKPEFSKLLYPNLQCVSCSFFKKTSYKDKLDEFIINKYQAFILILFKIILNFCSPIVLPEKSFSLIQAPLNELKNSFAYRMRA